MTTLRVKTIIRASPGVCFDLARDIGLHCRSAGQSRERAVAGVTEGAIGAGQWVTFEAVHFGVRQRLTSRITEFEPHPAPGRPLRFVDEMVEGAFVSLRHVHEFWPREGGTLMVDRLAWRSPLGMLGVLADLLLVRRHLRRFLRERNRVLKRAAEAR